DGRRILGVTYRLSMCPATSRPTTYPLSLHDALPICRLRGAREQLGEVDQHRALELGGGEDLARHEQRDQRDREDREQQVVGDHRSEEHTSELQSLRHIVRRLLPEKRTVRSCTALQKP